MSRFVNNFSRHFKGFLKSLWLLSASSQTLNKSLKRFFSEIYLNQVDVWNSQTFRSKEKLSKSFLCLLQQNDLKKSFWNATLHFKSLLTLSLSWHSLRNEILIWLTGKCWLIWIHVSCFMVWVTRWKRLG